MHKGLRAVAAIAILLCAIPLVSGPNSRRVEASGSDTVAFRAELIDYMIEMERTIPLLEAVGQQGGMGSEIRAQMRSLADESAAAREMLALPPSPDETRVWNEMERLLSFQRDWWEIPRMLQNVLSYQLESGSESSLDGIDSPHDDCGPGVSPILIFAIKKAQAIAEAVNDLMPWTFTISGFDIPNPIKLIVVIVKKYGKLAAEVLEVVNAVRASCKSGKVFEVLDKLDVMDGKLDEIKSLLASTERLQIEEDLTRTGDSRIGILQLPEEYSVQEVEGKLAQVRTIVMATLEEFKSADQQQRHAEAKDSFLRGDYWLGQGEFKEAYTQYRAAYRAGVTR